MIIRMYIHSNIQIIATHPKFRLPLTLNFTMCSYFLIILDILNEEYAMGISAIHLIAPPGQIIQLFYVMAQTRDE